ncbi:MAG TPA: carboxypeptidase-like regulatory domain-containing protein, partial [Acidimicrobiales bacterium]|nr:carboxypeptidase-like regulatory domain-containing protein [Acidimicrobiales bacterium]
MSAGGSITGTITDSSGNDLAGVCVEASQSAGTSGSTTTSAADGTYTLSGLAVGSYVVTFFNCSPSTNVLTQYYNGVTVPASAKLVSVVAGSTTGSINAAMVSGATISGTVSDAT